MLEIRENQIEDIFSTQLDEVRRLLSLDESLTLISRQKTLPSGDRLDLVYVSATSLHLMELKSLRCENRFCDQILRYRHEVMQLQAKREMPPLPLRAYLVCTAFTRDQIITCETHGITPIVFSPYEILKGYYFRVKAITTLIQMKPKNHGLWQLKLLNRIIYSVDTNSSIVALCKVTGLSRSTVQSYLSLATEVGLTVVNAQRITLSELGSKYFSMRRADMPTDYISDEQADSIRAFVTSHPFHSQATFGIYSAVEAVFALSKNFYPVPLEEAVPYFRLLSGKASEWGPKASNDGFRMYSNYCVELGLLAKMDNHFYLTPAGIKFILLLELNKSIMMVNAM